MSDYTTPDIYEDYKENVDEPLDEKTFKRLCEEFNQRVMDKVIYEGRPFEMGSLLSAIQVVRMKRDYSKKVVNWKKSYELRDKLLAEGKKLYDAETGEGHKWLVFHTDPWYCRFFWYKGFCRVPNKSAYKFVPTRGDKGNKTKLKEYLREDDINFKTFRQYKRKGED